VNLPTEPLSAERQWAHARAMRLRGTALPHLIQPPALVLDSWARCMQAGLDFAAAHTPPVVAATDLAQRRERAEVARRLAMAELETLAHQIAGSNYLLAFADHEGVILDLYADNRFAMNDDTAGIVPGSQWGEAVAGTNGLGTALATGQSVAVSGPEHYYLGLGDISCTATPVRDAQGDIVGALDASSCFESRQHHTQALVQMAATHIENGLLAHQMRGLLMLAIHPRAEFLGTLSAGLLAFDGAGQLRALNARGRHLLQGLDVSPGQSFESLFNEPYEHLLARLHRGGELRLRDRLGSSLVALCMNRPAPASGRTPQRPPQAGTDSAIELAMPGRPPGLPADVVADDPAVAEAFTTVAAAVRLKAPILIHGETGSGKELLARHAHQASGRNGAFVAVNCGAMPAELFEAELFGYAGGAFTGARREGSMGLIASADGGTLLLDELGELPMTLQSALLRFLDDQQVRPVGGTKLRKVDVQLVAATNVALDEAVAARRFRADLFYRLNTVSVSLPPLRRRRDFAAAVRATLALVDTGARIADDAIARLAHHPWPGNFRELRSVLTRAMLGAASPHLGLFDVAPLLPAAAAPPASALQQSATDIVRREFERTGRSVSQTSRNLGISRTTVYRHLREPGNQVSSLA
jgi:transcriptional regulator of acetoin/glycerol metabolism